MAKCRYNEMTQQMRSVPHPPTFQHMSQIPSQASAHHMPNISQHQQAPPPPPPHMNISSVQQSHMIHNHQNYHQNRSGGQLHNHHSQQQRLGYGPNRPNFQNGNHNMHNNHGGGVNANIPSNVPASQQQQQTSINKHRHQQQESNLINIQHQSNQTRYKQMDASATLNNNTSNKENLLNVVNNDNSAPKLIIEMNHGCADDQNGGSATNSSVSSSHTTKTAMCLINEIVRSNQLKHQYRVTDESGPSHERVYTVVLELGEERYTAQSKTIKGAQHTAAAMALEKTKYKNPKIRHVGPRFMARHQREKSGSANTITPTVQLNALAMKIGIPTSYAYQYPESFGSCSPSDGRDGRLKGIKKRFRDKYNNNRLPPLVHRTTEDDPFRVMVLIGDRRFSGTGLTMQQAKHDAAAKALAELKDEAAKSQQTNASSNLDSSDKSTDENGDLMSENNVDRMKSSISVVQEIAQKRNLPIRFMVENESGPAHMKHFVIKCTVGDIETTGDGNSKKVAKKRAAENMLNELKKLPPLRIVSEAQTNGRRNNRSFKRNVLSANGRQQVQNVNSRRKLSTSNPAAAAAAAAEKTAAATQEANTSTISNETTSDESELNNPIALLLRIQQATKQAEPLFKMIEERTQNHRKQFIMEVSYADIVARGTGGNKKQAKREAAKAMLSLLGYGDSSSSSSSSNSSNSTMIATIATPNSEKLRKTKYMETKANQSDNHGQAINRPLPPGVLYVKSPDNNKKSPNSNRSSLNHTTATIAKELLNAGTSPTAEAIIKQQNSPAKANIITPTEMVTPVVEVSPTTQVEPNNNTVVGGEAKATAQSNDRGIRAADQLLYLADLLKFTVQFDDFPKGNHNDYLTLASLTTDPPQMFHGYGNSLEASKNQAASAALKALSELGLDNVNKPRDKPSKSILSNGKSN